MEYNIPPLNLIKTHDSLQMTVEEGLGSLCKKTREFLYVHSNAMKNILLFFGTVFLPF